MNPKKSLKIIGVIPARYASSRFPGKPLADIHGKPMIWWVYKNAKKTKLLSTLVVATDDAKIAKACSDLNIPCIMTSTTHKTGTDRIGEVARKITGDLYVNIQGDEPLISPAVVDAVIKPLLSDNYIGVSNIMTTITSTSDLLNTNVVKVVVNAKDEAVYYSRHPIPFPKNSENPEYFRQSGIYCFRPDTLKQFCSLLQGIIEKREEIEFLRFVENHVPIKMVLAKYDSIAVDTPDDLKLVRKILKRGRNIKDGISKDNKGFK